MKREVSDLPPNRLMMYAIPNACMTNAAAKATGGRVKIRSPVRNQSHWRAESAHLPLPKWQAAKATLDTSIESVVSSSLNEC